MKISLVVVAVVFSLGFGCASNPKKIGAAYVSPLKYNAYDCDQVALEMDHVGRRTTELFHSLKSDNTADKWQMGLGLTIFWPTLFLLEGGDGPEAAEYAQLKGEYEALRVAAVDKKCVMESLPPSPEELVKGEDGKKQKAVEEKKTGSR